jgi:hypothetical protein
MTRGMNTVGILRVLCGLGVLAELFVQVAAMERPGGPLVNGRPSVRIRSPAPARTGFSAPGRGVRGNRSHCGWRSQRSGYLLKRGLSGTVDQWPAAAEYVAAQGNEQVILCERATAPAGAAI